MSNTIKITETQLKMLMEQSQEQRNFEDGQSTSIDQTTDDQTDAGDPDEQNLDTIKSNVGSLLGNGFDRDKLKEMITGLIDSYNSNELGNPDEDYDNSLPPGPTHDEAMQNQVYESIKKDFKRYL
jgi:hypothetical protein